MAYGPVIGGLQRDVVPVPKDYQPAVVPGSRTRATPILSAERMIKRLQKSMHSYGASTFGAFYSSAAGGIITDPALMLLPMDDQFVSLGYGVSECVLLRNGYLYMLDEHMARLMAACERAGLELPFTEPALRRIVLDVAAASMKLNGMLRFWVTPGRSGFGTLSPSGSEPGFYAICIGDVYNIERTEGFSAAVAPVPAAVGAMSNLHTNQHMLTAWAQRVAQAEGADVAIFTDSEGFVQHCAGFNLCITTKRDVLVYPPHEAVPPSVMMARMLEMMPEERARSPDDVLISDVQQRKLHISEVEAAKECFLVCSTYLIAPVKSVGSKPIADGRPGITALALHYMLDNELMDTKGRRHTPVPYGYPTGMRSQLV